MYLGRAGKSMREYGIADPDEAYVIALSARWVMNLIRTGVPVDEEMVEICTWILGDRIRGIIDVARRWFAEKGLDVPYRLEMGSDSEVVKVDLLKECELMEDDWDAAFEKTIKTAGGEYETVIADTLLRLLEESQGGFAPPDCRIRKAEVGLREYFNLSEAEVRLCTFLYAECIWQEVDQYFDSHLGIKKRSRVGALAIMCGVSLEEMCDAVNGKLLAMGLIDARMAEVDLNDKFRVIYEAADPLGKLQAEFTPMTGPAVPLEDFLIDEDVVRMVQSHLAGKDDTPTHILLYGAPGTGKTSFAYSLGKAAGMKVYPVPLERDRESFPRQAGVEACLHITSGGSKGVVVVDEADTMLNTQRGFLISGERQDKGWINELLERPGLRMIWITNDHGGIEDSVKDRFCFSIEFEPLDQRRRELLWDRIARSNKVKRLLPEAAIKDFAERHKVSARSITLAVRKARRVAGGNGPEFRRQLECMLQAKGELQSIPSAPRGRKKAVNDVFSSSGLSIDCDYGELLDSVRRIDRHLRGGGQGRAFGGLLFHGHPGTGKTELAKHIAEEIDRELLVVRASSLLDVYVGGTEQKIARAFSAAQENGHLLVVDEVDTFLFKRSMAMRPLEVSMVNEFLSQMEAFQGLLICTTNRYESLCSAAYRRFGRKVRFGYLDDGGKAALYESLLAPKARSRPTRDTLARLHGLQALTPGDFRVVQDMFAFHRPGEVTHEAMLAELEKVVRDKRSDNSRRPIGFRAW